MTIVTSRPQFTGYAENIFDTVLNEPTGFIDRTTSSISFDPVTREFTLTPIGPSEIWIRGKRINLTTSISITISDVYGFHYIYIEDPNDPHLLEQTNPKGFTPDLLLTKALVATIFWNPDHQIAASVEDHRHGTAMDGTTLYYFNEVYGSAYLNGLGITNIQADQSGDLDSHAQFSIANGSYRNQDLLEEFIDDDPQDLAPIAQIPILYRLGINGHWNIKPATDFPLIESGTAGFTGTNGRPAWNQNVGGTWQLTTVDATDFFNVHYFAVPELNNRILGILGQATYTKIDDAENGVPNELGTTLAPFHSPLLIGTVIFETRNNYDNAVAARIRSIGDGSDYVDWREPQSLNVALTGTGVVDHGLLTGLEDDDHPQYLTETRGDARYYTQDQVDSLTDQLSLTTISTDTTLDNTADLWLVSGATTVTLPLSSNFPNRRFHIKRIGIDDVTIVASGTDNIDGDASLTIGTQYTNITVVSDGNADWYII